MIYRCLSCRHEAVGGFLPSVTRGLYLLFLIGLSVACMAGALNAMVGNRPVPAEKIETPWWFTVVGVIIVLVLTIVGAVAIKLLIELAEYLTFVWRRCPTCGARRWSWGFTRGFGL